MNSVIAVSILILSFLQGTMSFLNGFPKEQCDEMDPTKIKIDEAMIKAAESDYNNTDGGSEDAVVPTSLQLSGTLNLYRIMTSTKYRRGRTLNITIRGPEFNAVMLQVRKIGADERRGFDQAVRVGEFISWPPSLQPVKCDKDQVTALTNKNYVPKLLPTVVWKAPKEDVGEIQVVARFVNRDEYWPIMESREILLNEFPANLKNCGKAKSCILYSEKSASCIEDNCDYILTYSVLNSTSVEFVLGGTSKGPHTYLAVGFSTTPEAEKMKMIACVRGNTAAEIKFFTLQTMEDGLMEHPMHLENHNLDFEENRLWCRFVAPMVTPSEEGNGLDLSVPLYQVYLRGTTNYTKSVNIPILPSKLLVSKKEVSLDKIKVQHHTLEKPKQNSGSDALTMLHLLLLFTVLLPLQNLKNSM